MAPLFANITRVNLRVLFVIFWYRCLERWYDTLSQALGSWSQQPMRDERLDDREP